jgi:excisionase family DNA binding protein
MERFTDVLTTKQAAEALGMTHGAVRRAIADKRLASFKVGASNRLFVTAEEVERYRQERLPSGRPAGSRDSKPRKARAKPEDRAAP